MKRLSRPALATTVLLTVVCATTPLAAQTDEPIFAELERMFKQPYLSIGLLIQTRADVQIERSVSGENGFSLGNARLKVGGELDAGFGYYLQTDFLRSPAILDARVSYRFRPNIGLWAGQMKAPFSYEVLTSSGDIDFVRRSQVANALGPSRQLGAQVRFGASERSTTVAAGVFNGNRIAPNGNDGDGFLAVSRVELTTAPRNDASLIIGGNLGYAEDDAVVIPGVDPSFAGERALIGADARFTSARLLLSGEVIYARLESPLGFVREPWGFHATVGYDPTEKTQLLFRWDRFDAGTVAGASNLLIGALNAWPTGATKVQVNYIIDTDDAALDHHQVLVNFQVAF